jgi:uncharacterized protein (DUF2461 family)
MEFTGFCDQAFSFYEQVAANPTWDFVWSRQQDWEDYVHVPMEALLEGLGAEFGRNAHAYYLHKDPRLWSAQMGIISVADTIGYRVMLSLDGLRAQAGWIRSSADQLERYRRRAAAQDSGRALAAAIARARQAGFTIEGSRLATHPRGWPADHPRVELLRYRTLGASKMISPDVVSGPECLDAVSSAWREVRPLVAWLSRHVGPRQRGL